MKKRRSLLFPHHIDKSRQKAWMACITNSTFPLFFTCAPRYQIKRYSTSTITTTRSTTHTFHSSFCSLSFHDTISSSLCSQLSYLLRFFCGFRRNRTFHESCSQPVLQRFRPLPCFSEATSEQKQALLYQVGLSCIELIALVLGSVSAMVSLNTMNLIRLFVYFGSPIFFFIF